MSRTSTVTVFLMMGCFYIMSAIGAWNSEETSEVATEKAMRRSSHIALPTKVPFTPSAPADETSTTATLNKKPVLFPSLVSDVPPSLLVPSIQTYTHPSSSPHLPSLQDDSLSDAPTTWTQVESTGSWQTVFRFNTNEESNTDPYTLTTHEITDEAWGGSGTRVFSISTSATKTVIYNYL